MSLINDALKRAKQTQGENLAPASGPALTPLERRATSDKPDFLMPALVVVILLLAGLLFWQWFLGRNTTVRARTIPVATNPGPVQQVQAIAAAPAITATAAQPTVTNAVVAVAPPKPAPITYRLQSVIYVPKNPAAVINGKTVHRGSTIGEARVVDIQQESATIVTDSGETKVLELP